MAKRAGRCVKRDRVSLGSDCCCERLGVAYVGITLGSPLRLVPGSDMTCHHDGDGAA